MASVIKRENMTIAIREYTDNQGNQKKVWKTIGELITWDDGNQSFEIWGPGGLTKGSIFEQQQNNQGQQQQMNQGYQQQPQQGFQQQGNFNPDGSPMNPQQMQQQMQGGAPNPDIPF